MSLFDTLGSYQTNVFPYAGCPLRYKAENSKEVEFMVDSGSTYYNISSKLKEQGLIRNEFCFKLYVLSNSSKC